jgi:hypothetical protein
VAIATGKEITLRQGDVISVLTDPLAQELQRSEIPARRAFTGLDGGLRVIPVGSLWNGAQFGVGTAANAPTVRANSPVRKV